MKCFVVLAFSAGILFGCQRPSAESLADLKEQPIPSPVAIPAETPQGGLKDQPIPVPVVTDEIPVLVRLQDVQHRIEKGKLDKSHLRNAADDVLNELGDRLGIPVVIQDRYLAALLPLGEAADVPLAIFKDRLSGRWQQAARKARAENDVTVLGYLGTIQFFETRVGWAGVFSRAHKLSAKDILKYGPEWYNGYDRRGQGEGWMVGMKEECGAKSFLLAECAFVIGRAAVRQKRDEDAGRYLNEALVVFRQYPGWSHEPVARCLTELANVQRGKDPVAARRLLEEAKAHLEALLLFRERQPGGALAGKSAALRERVEAIQVELEKLK